MATAETITLKLAKVDRDLVRRAKHAALDRGITLREFVLEALERSAPRAEGRTQKHNGRAVEKN
jgi:hypothetical protein